MIFYKKSVYSHFNVFFIFFNFEQKNPHFHEIGVQFLQQELCDEDIILFKIACKGVGQEVNITIGRHFKSLIMNLQSKMRFGMLTDL